MDERSGGMPSEAWPRPGRAEVRGRVHAVSANHSLAALAAFQVLEAGGNAIDAGVAAGLVTNVVQPDCAGFGGIAPIIVYRAATREVLTLAGTGWYPAGVSADWLRERHGGIPYGAARHVVPGAPDAWLAALSLCGTRSLGEVASFAIDAAAGGFPVHEFLAGNLRRFRRDFERWEASRPVFLPGGQPPPPGTLFVQPALARLLREMVEAERQAAPRGRAAALEAARDHFYRGPVARRLVEASRAEGGAVTLDDFGDYRVRLEPPASVPYRDCEVYGCGPWSQGPMLLQALRLLDGTAGRLPHNGPEYVHRLTEALKLAAADRERYYGDPLFVDVPLGPLLSEAYARVRRALVRPEAWPGLPPPGEPSRLEPAVEVDWPAWFGTPAPALALDTSYLCVMDREGNVFSATPSDTTYDTPLVPELGIAMSSRGSQGYLVEGHPNVVAPRKRPRITPNPALALRDGRPFMAWGTPGGDVQPQAMLQVFLNVVERGMSPQQAVEAPRFASYSLPDSFWPHPYDPGRLRLEPALAALVEPLTARGHRVALVPEESRFTMGGVCVVVRDPDTGLLGAGADPRRECYAAAR